MKNIEPGFSKDRKLDKITNSNRKEKRILPGEYYVTDENMIISTLLGSCVSACLYDPEQGVMGMNHFLLSNNRYSRDIPILLSEAGRYGINAMELLINDMLKLGAKKNDMKAKVFGGANVIVNKSGIGNFLCVGDVNSRFIKKFLEIEKIPLTASDLGGSHGRVIYFSFGDYYVYARKIKKRETFKLEEKERVFWTKSIEEHEKESPKLDLW
jgi:chemotaxis protein CheD